MIADAIAKTNPPGNAARIKSRGGYVAACFSSANSSRATSASANLKDWRYITGAAFSFLIPRAPSAGAKKKSAGRSLHSEKRSTQGEKCLRSHEFGTQLHAIVALDLSHGAIAC